MGPEFTEAPTVLNRKRSPVPATVYWLLHTDSQRMIPIEGITVFGRSGAYHDYREAGDQRLEHVAEQLAAHTYVQIEGDNRISRTHGLFDPAFGTLTDLNSTNGLSVNGALLARDASGRLPDARPLEHGDRVRVGHQEFVVTAHGGDLRSVEEQLAGSRRALICHGGPQAAALGQLLKRKNVGVEHYSSGEALYERLFEGPWNPNGVAVICLDDAGLTHSEFETLVMTLARLVPGRKIVTLEAEHDASTYEAIFKERATRDMALLTSVGQAALDRPLLDEGCSDPVKQAQAGIRGRSTPGAHDDLVDGLDALLHLTSNRLDTEWAKDYRGRLGVAFGALPPQGEVLHDLELGTATHRMRSRHRRHAPTRRPTYPGEIATCAPSYARPRPSRGDAPLDPSWQVR